jgi:hypothetical protein
MNRRQVHSVNVFCPDIQEGNERDTVVSKQKILRGPIDPMGKGRASAGGESQNEREQPKPLPRHEVSQWSR